MALGIIGIVIALLVFLYGAYKNVSTLYLAPIAGVIVAVTNGISATQAFTQYYIGVVEHNVHTDAWEIGGVTGMILAVFPTIFLGALFGKVLTDCGAAGAIANVMTSKLIMSAEGKEKQAKRAVLSMLLVECILSYGGVDGFVTVFATFPIAMVMADRIGIPRRFVPAMLCLSCGANSAPFVLSINNILCMAILGTSPGAALIPGLICFVVIEVGVYFICSKMIISAMRKGEGFDYGNCPRFGEQASSKEHPNLIIALLPLIVVFLIFAILQNASLALTAGILLAIILMSQYFPKNGEANGVGAWVGKIVNSLNEGAVSGAQSLMIICAAAGFAGVVQHTETFNAFVGMMMGLPVPPMVVAMIMIIVIVAFTSSPPAALGIALPILASSFVAAGAINPAALARVSAIAVSTFETLPVNGLILLTTGLAQVKIKEAYLPMFLQTVIMTLIGTVLCWIILMVAPGLA
ncbi:MAG: GntP family permease [Lachnospiraceae bacterium]|nr:GntP family permease [Lachnospiraceae bacterium]